MAPYLTKLPDAWVPYALVLTLVIVVLLALDYTRKKAADFWRSVTWAPITIWRWITGTKPPPSEAAIATESAKRAEEAALRSERNTEEILRNQVEAAKQAGETVPGDTLAQAIAAMREVLQSNDPSKGEAQDALRNNDPRGAEDALAKAFEREVKEHALLDDQTQQLKAKAARTAREKAALAATHSVAESLSWYEKAAALDPEDCWTHIELARRHKAKGDLPSALGAAQTALKHAADDRNHSAALNEIGNVLSVQGDLPKALESFQAAMDIAARLARADDSNAGLQRELSVSHEKIGDVQHAQGELPKALASFQAAMGIRARLLLADDSNAGFQRDLSVSHNKIGDVQHAQGELPKALASFQAAMGIRARLARADDSNAGLQRDLSVSHNRIGDVQRAQGDLPKALESYRADMDIAERLARADTSNAGLQRDLSVSHEKIGDVHAAKGEFAAAIKSYEASLLIAQSLADRFPEHRQFQSDLLIIKRKLRELRAREE